MMGLKLSYPSTADSRLMFLNRAVNVAQSEAANGFALDQSMITRLVQGHEVLAQLLQNRSEALLQLREKVEVRKKQDQKVGYLVSQSWKQAKTHLNLGLITEGQMTGLGFSKHGLFQRSSCLERLQLAKNLLVMDEALTESNQTSIAFPDRETLETEVGVLELMCQEVDEADLQLGEIRKTLRGHFRVVDHLIRLLRMSLQHILTGRPVTVIRRTMRRFGFNFKTEGSGAEGEATEGAPTTGEEENPEPATPATEPAEAEEVNV